jgi:ATP-dependent 26S proteasome regulatory subunit
METTNTFESSLFLCLKSDYPLVFIVTQEEQRAFSIVEKTSLSLGKKLFYPRIRGETTTVQALLQRSEETDAVIVLDNVHRTLHEVDSVRSLADAVAARQKKTLVVIAPFVNLPPELERISAVLELPLPSHKELDAALIKACEKTAVLLSDTDIARHVRAAQGMTESEAYLSFKKALMGWPDNVVSSLMSVASDKKSMLRKSSVLEAVDISKGLHEVGGLDRLKDWLTSRREAFTDSARSFGLPAPRGLLLMGVQGCGKSLSAKAVASHWQLPLARLDISAVFGDDHPEWSLRNAFRISEAMAPMVLWIDELEKGFDRGETGRSSRLLGGMVTWLQEKTKEVFVVATANQVDHLPPELPRKGRFDEIFFVDLPDFSERIEIFKIHLIKRGRDPSHFNISQLAKDSHHLTGSEIEQIIISGLYIAFSRGSELSDADLMFALRETVPLYDTFESEIKSLREWARKRARPASTDRRKADMFS